MSDLPNGWDLCSLGELGVWSSGGTPSRTNKDFFGGSIRWIKSGDLPDGPILRTDESITEAALEQSAAKLLPVNTICIALYGATIGKLGITTFPAATNQAVANLILNSDLINVRYVFYFLKSARSYLVGLGQGGAQPNISQQIVRETKIRVAPFKEQKRIAEKLDSLLSRVDSCRERLDRVPAILRRFRQSVLAAAASGKLTEQWRAENQTRSHMMIMSRKAKSAFLRVTKGLRSRNFEPFRFSTTHPVCPKLGRYTRLRNYMSRTC